MLLTHNPLVCEDAVPPHMEVCYTTPASIVLHTAMHKPKTHYTLHMQACEELVPPHTEVFYTPHQPGAPYGGVYIFTQVRAAAGII